MREMMLRKEHLFLRNTQFCAKCAGKPELVCHPRDHGFAEYCIRPRIGLQRSNQNAVQLSKRLLQKDKVGELKSLYSALFVIEPVCILWITAYVFYSQA